MQVFEVSEHDGLPFFSLEFVDGGSLDKKLNGTPLPPRDAARLVEQVACAMHAAHRQQVIHRDLKPANILLTSEGQPKVTDFGLAKALDVEQGHTATGAIMGTPSYMAPEQAGGNTKEIGPATDIYALGAVLYECLTGRPPFRAATTLDTILQALSDEPVPPRQLNAKVPRDLETICLECLRKEPARRYASAANLAEDLRRFREGEPIRARPVGKAEKALKWVKRRPALAALLAVLLLATLGLTGGGVWFTLRLDEARRRAEGLAEAEGKAREETLKQLDRVEKVLYVNRIARAAGETDALRLLHSNEILDECRPEQRGWEWHHLRFRNHFTVPLLSLEGHTDPVSSVAFSPDGSRLASAGGNLLRPDLLLWTPGEVKLWDARTGAQRFSLKGHTGGVVSVAFSPDGKRLAGGTDTGLVKVWDARREKDDDPASRARRQQEDDETTIAWHLQQSDLAGKARDPFAARFHLDHALAELRRQVDARLTEDDIVGCRQACAVLAAVAGQSGESIGQFQEVLARGGGTNPAVDEWLLALAYHQRGQPAEARRWLGRATVSIERPGLRPATALLGGAGAGPLPALTLLPDLPPRALDEPARHELQSLRRQIEAIRPPRP